jgi:non-specific serine/threonine protein kinase
MTQPELGLLPSGHLHWFPATEHSDTDQTAELAAEQISVADTFSRDIAAGMIALAAQDSAADLSPTVAYWRGFTCRYLAERCQIVQVEPSRPEPVDALDEQQIESLREAAPPMRGAEYLSAQALNGIWFWLDDRVCTQIRQHRSLSAFLEQIAAS